MFIFNLIGFQMLNKENESQINWFEFLALSILNCVNKSLLQLQRIICQPFSI